MTVYQALEHRFRVRTDSPSIDSMVSHLLKGWIANGDSLSSARVATYRLKSSSRDRAYALLRSGRLLSTAGSLQVAINWLVWQINHEAIRRARRFVLVHAGAVSWNGDGILLPAPMESGKTTLSA